MTDTTTDKKTKAKNNYVLRAEELGKKLQMECVPRTDSIVIYAVDEDGDLVSKVKTIDGGQNKWTMAVAYLEGRHDEKRGA